MLKDPLLEMGLYALDNQIMRMKLTSALCVFAITATWQAGVDAARPSRPNIVLMMADDMGLGDTTAYMGVRFGPAGEPVALAQHTPSLNAFAEHAVVFNNAYAPASMCSSTRYSLLTGRFAHRCYLKQQGWLPHGPNTPMIQRALSTLPEMLSARGYRTAAIGKYHVGMAFDNGNGKPATHYYYEDVDFKRPVLDGPTHHGFDEFFGVPGNTEDSLDTEPRIYIRNDRWTFTDRDRMRRIGFKHREPRIFAAPDWDLAQIGPVYLREVQAFLQRQAKAKEPFFLYYVPNANHFQRNQIDGDYAVPRTIAGEAVKGASRLSDGTQGDDRADMILENDIAFGKLMETLRNTDDPRWPGHRLIENTLVIFTSDNGPNVGDNLGRNRESGGLRGKKAKIWEGGIRVPLLVYWKDKIEGGTLNESIVSQTDFYATLASVTGHALAPHEAQDSHDCLRHWTGQTQEPDPRPRVFFCHLGPPFSNDTLVIRKGPYKLLVEGGLALPSIPDGHLGAAIARAFYDLDQNLYENDEAKSNPALATQLAAELLRIHNRGHARELNLRASNALIQAEGWHNLRNDVTGEIGFEFTLTSKPRTVTHLGIWDDHERDRPIRMARAIADETQRDQPSLPDPNGQRRGLAAPHTIRLVQLDATPPCEIARIRLPAGAKGQLEGAFRYLPLPRQIKLHPDRHYALLASTQAGDGDHFKDPAAFDGLSPLVEPSVSIRRSLLIRNEDLTHPLPIPAFSDLSPDFNQHRLPVGPTLKFF